MNAIIQALNDLPAASDLPVPLDVLARLAIAAGHEARNTRTDRVQAEHHLGMAVSMLSRGGESPLVTITQAKDLLLLIATITFGNQNPALELGMIVVAPRPEGRCSICGRPWRNGACTFMPEHARLGREIAPALGQ